MKDINGWLINNKENYLEKEFHFKSYLKNISFVNAVAWIANNYNHHPELLIKYNVCIVKITTHDTGQITNKDYDLANAIDQLFTKE